MVVIVRRLWVTNTKFNSNPFIFATEKKKQRKTTKSCKPSSSKDNADVLQLCFWAKLWNNLWSHLYLSVKGALGLMFMWILAVFEMKWILLFKDINKPLGVRMLPVVGKHMCRHTNYPIKNLTHRWVGRGWPLALSCCQTGIKSEIWLPCKTTI